MDRETIGVLVGAVVVIMTYRYWLKKSRGPKYPPGPLGLPGVGSMLSMEPNPSLKFIKVARKYGSIFSYQMGWMEWIVINDYESAREALVKQGDKFAGRPELTVTGKLSDGHGIILIDNGPMWKSQRIFGLKTLTGFGLGKTSLEARIHEEAGFLVETLRKSKGESINCQGALTNAVSNIICGIVMGSRFSYDDERFKNIIARLSRSFSDNIDARLLALMTLVSSFRFLPFFRGAYKRQFVDLYAIFDTLREIVDEHKSAYDENNIKDFIDAFLKEMKNPANEGSFFTDKQLFHYVRDLFVAGTDTTSNSLRWSILSLLHWPECQERVQKEIDSVIGDEMPSMKHREQMPYTCAWIQEVMRHRPMLPVMAPRKTCADVTLRGYQIPKGTSIMVNIWAIHHDPTYFDNPAEFRPERFLDEDGKYVPCAHVIPFSIGPRQCLGYQLVKMEMFIFLTSILQKLKVQPDPKKAPASFHSGVFGLTYVAYPFNALFAERKAL